tara:strand:+ start:214 stop:375 length:162 start_codon:yes stop_codon:yes gene_type:complete
VKSTIIEYHPQILYQEERKEYGSILSENQFEIKDKDQNIEFWSNSVFKISSNG